MADDYTPTRPRRVLGLAPETEPIATPKPKQNVAPSVKPKKVATPKTKPANAPIDFSRIRIDDRRGNAGQVAQGLTRKKVSGQVANQPREATFSAHSMSKPTPPPVPQVDTSRQPDNTPKQDSITDIVRANVPDKNSAIGQVLGGLVGLEESFAASSRPYQIARGLYDRAVGNDPSRPDESVLGIAKSIYGGNTGYNTASTVGGLGRGLLTNIAGNMAGGPLGAGLVVGADTATQAFAKGLTDSGKSLPEVTKDALYTGTKEGIKAGALNKLLAFSPVNSAVERVAGSFGSGAGKAAAGLATRVGLGGLENVATSGPIDVGIDAIADVGKTVAQGKVGNPLDPQSWPGILNEGSRLMRSAAEGGDTNLGANRYLRSPGQSFGEDFALGGSLAPGLNLRAGVQGYKRGGLTEGARGLATGNVSPVSRDGGGGTLVPPRPERVPLDMDRTISLPPVQAPNTPPTLKRNRRTSLLEDEANRTSDLMADETGQMTLPGMSDVVPSSYAPENVFRAADTQAMRPRMYFNNLDTGGLTGEFQRQMSLDAELPRTKRVAPGIIERSQTDRLPQLEPIDSSPLPLDEFGRVPSNWLDAVNRANIVPDSGSTPLDYQENLIMKMGKLPYPVEGRGESILDPNKIFRNRRFETGELVPPDVDSPVAANRNELFYGDPSAYETKTNVLNRPPQQVKSEMSLEAIRSKEDMYTPRAMQGGELRPTGAEVIKNRVNSEFAAKLASNEVTPYEVAERLAAELAPDYQLLPVDIAREVQNVMSAYRPPKRASVEAGTGEDLPVPPGAESIVKAAVRPDEIPTGGLAPEPVLPPTPREQTKGLVPSAIEGFSPEIKQQQSRFTEIAPDVPLSETGQFYERLARYNAAKDIEKSAPKRIAATETALSRMKKDIGRPDLLKQPPLTVAEPARPRRLATPEEGFSIATKAAEAKGAIPVAKEGKKFVKPTTGAETIVESAKTIPPTVKPVASKAVSPSEVKGASGKLALSAYSPNEAKRLTNALAKVNEAKEFVEAARNIAKTNPQAGEAGIRDAEIGYKNALANYENVKSQADISKAKRETAIRASEAKKSALSKVEAISKADLTPAKRDLTPDQIFQQSKQNIAKNLTKTVEAEVAEAQKQMKVYDADLNDADISASAKKDIQARKDFLDQQVKLNRTVADLINKNVYDIDSVKASYDEIAATLAANAPPEPLRKGVNASGVTIKGAPVQGEVVRMDAKNVWLETKDGVVKLDRENVSPVAGEMPKPLAEMQKALAKIQKIENERRASIANDFGEVIRNLPKLGQKGALFPSGANLAQRVAPFKAAVNKLATNIYNYGSTKYQGLNKQVIKEAISGDKGIAESMATAVNLAKLVSVAQRGRDVGSTISWQIMDNGLKRPVAAMTDLMLSALTGKRTTVMNNYLDSVGNSLIDAQVALGKGVAAATPIVGERFMSPEALKIYKEGKLEGLFGAATLTNPLLRGMTEIDTVMKSGIRKDATKNEIYLQAFNEYAQLKASNAPNLQSKKAFLAKRIGEIGAMVEKYNDQVAQPKRDFELAEKIATKAEVTATEGVLQQDNMLSTAIEGLFSSMKTTDAKGRERPAIAFLQYLAKTQMPFLKIRANDAWKKFQYTPVKAAVDLAWGIGTRDQELIADAVGRGTIGSALTMLGWAGYKAFAPPAEFSEREPAKRKLKALNEASNRNSQDLRIREGLKMVAGIDVPELDYNAKVNFLSGLNTMMAFGSRMRYEAEREQIEKGTNEPLDLASMLKKERPNTTAALMDLLYAGGKMFGATVAMEALEHPLTSTIGEELNTLREERSMSGFAADVVTNVPYAIPGLNPLMIAGSKISQATDPYQRIVEDPGRSFVQGVTDRLQRNIPGTLGGYGRENLPSRLDAYGRPVKNLRTTAIDPFQVRSDAKDPLLNVMTNLVTGPTPIQRDKDQPISSYRYQQSIEGPGAYQAQMRFLPDALMEGATRQELVEGLAEAGGRGKTLASEGADPYSSIDGAEIIQMLRRKKQTELDKKIERGY